MRIKTKRRKASGLQNRKADKMKHKTTAAAIRKNYPKNLILNVGYCNMQNLLRYEQPTGYTCGVYGWNFDLYEIEGVAICTGYRGVPASRDFNFDLLQKYENKARKEIEKRKPENMTWDKYDKQKKTKVKKLLLNFIKEVYTK